MLEFSVCLELFWRNEPVPERMRKIAALGFRACEFWGWSKKDLAAIRAAQDETGVAVAAIGAEPSGSLTGRGELQVLTEGIAKSAVAARTLGCKQLIVVAGRKPADETWELTRRRVVRRLKAAARVAEDGGVSLLLEPINALVEMPASWLVTMAQAVDVVAEVDSPNVKVLDDLFQQQTSEGNLIANLQEYAPWIGEYHLAGVPGFCELVGGELDYRSILAAIAATGYDSYVGLEFEPKKLSDEAALRQALSLLWPQWLGQAMGACDAQGAPVRLTQVVRDVGTDFLTAGQPESYAFPEDWHVKEYWLKETKPLGPDGIEEALARPFPWKGGTGTLDALVQGKRNVVILVDDLSRPTRPHEILPPILRRLQDAGVPDERVRFIVAVGIHRPLTAAELALKIGEENARRYPWENHDAFSSDVAKLGYTAFGTPVWVNRKVAEADLVISMNAVIRHRFCYAGGGSKMIVPGVAHHSTTLINHRGMEKVTRTATHKYGRTRSDMDDVARLLAALTDHVAIDVAVNHAGETTALFIGEPVQTWMDHVDEALGLYEVAFNKGDYPAGLADIGFFRMCMLSNDAVQLSRAIDGWQDVCRVPIIISDCGDGIFYLGTIDGPFQVYKDSLAYVDARPNPPLAEALQPVGSGMTMLFSPHLDMKSAHMKNPGMYLARDWDGFVRELHSHFGPESHVAFFHHGPLQILKAC